MYSEYKLFNPYVEKICEGLEVQYSIDKFTILFVYDTVSDHDVRQRLINLVGDNNVTEFTYRSFYYDKFCIKPSVKFEDCYIEVGTYSEKSKKVVIHENIQEYDDESKETYSRIDTYIKNPTKVPVPYCKIDFNPNKASMLNIKQLCKVFKKKCMYANLMKYDIACDVKLPKYYVRVDQSRRIVLNYGNETTVIGKESNHNYLKIYDKRKEILKNLKYDIGYDLTRIEATCVLHKNVIYPTILEKIYISVGDADTNKMTPSEKFKMLTYSKLIENGVNPIDLAKVVGMSYREIKTMRKLLDTKTIQFSFNNDIINSLVMQLLIKLNIQDVVENF